MAAKRQPMAQSTDVERNDELAALATVATAVKSAEDVLPVREKALPTPTGRVYDLGGDVVVVCVTPRYPLDGHTLFRGDHAKVTEDTASANPLLVRL